MPDQTGSDRSETSVVGAQASAGSPGGDVPITGVKLHTVFLQLYTKDIHIQPQMNNEDTRYM